MKRSLKCHLYYIKSEHTETENSHILSTALPFSEYIFVPSLDILLSHIHSFNEQLILEKSNTQMSGQLLDIIYIQAQLLWLVCQKLLHVGVQPNLF